MESKYLGALPISKCSPSLQKANTLWTFRARWFLQISDGGIQGALSSYPNLSLHFDKSACYTLQAGFVGIFYRLPAGKVYNSLLV